MDGEIKEVQREPVQEVIDNLEKMLTEAKDGHLRSFIAIKLFSAEGGSGQAWAGLKVNDTPKLLGEILMMASRLSIKLDGIHAEDIVY